MISVFERSARSGKLVDALVSLKRYSTKHPQTDVLFPSDVLSIGKAAFLAFSLCSGKAGTASPTITTVVAKVVGSTIQVGFAYGTGATAGCDVSIDTVELQVGSSGVTGGPIFKTATENAGSGPAGYSGTVNPGTISGGIGALVGTTQQLKVTFKLDNAAWCDTCTLAAGASNPVIVNVVIS